MTTPYILVAGPSRKPIKTRFTQETIDKWLAFKVYFLVRLSWFRFALLSVKMLFSS